MKKIIFILIFLVGGISLYKVMSDSSSQYQEEEESESTASSSKTSLTKKSSQDLRSNKNTEKSKKGNIASKTKKSLSPEEKKTLLEENKKFAEREISFKPQDEEEASLLETQRVMATFYNVPQSEKNLINFFEEKGLKPEVNKDSNPYTGSMTTVRTQKSLPGTRYNHAQYFANEKGESYLQHYSIEYRPGPQAFERTQEMVESLYNVKNGKMSDDGNFISYKLSDDYILWVKRMGKDDLKGDPFNAYEENDVGTIRMAIEMEIHDSENPDDEHMHPPENTEDH